MNRLKYMSSGKFLRTFLPVIFYLKTPVPPIYIHFDLTAISLTFLTLLKCIQWVNAGKKPDLLSPNTAIKCDVLTVLVSLQG